MASKPPPEKAPKTANEPTTKNMDKLVNDPDFGSMKNTSGTGTAEPKKGN